MKRQWGGDPYPGQRAHGKSIGLKVNRRRWHRAP
uniref:Uncharacterized protein n=1 Tax=Amphimedon queenslandica TaxID=400682 RepID=A0A1X7TVB9_AMPQE